MKNWKHYSMKIVAKHKKSSQNLWESLKQPLYIFFLNKFSNFEKKNRTI